MFTIFKAKKYFEKVLANDWEVSINYGNKEA